MGKISEALRGLTFARQQNVPPPGGTADPWSSVRLSLPRERSYLNDVGDGSGSSLVVPAIDFIANGFIEARVRVSERKGDDFQVIHDHGMTEQLARPNPHYSGALLWMATLASFVGDGNGFWIITDFSAAGRPAAWYWAPPWSLEPKGSPDGRQFLTHYRYEPGGGAKGFDLDPMQVVHFRWGMDPGNPRKGFSRLKSVLREIYSDEESARFTAALLRNMGVPGLVISPKDGEGQTFEEAQALKADIIQKTTGDRRGEALVPTQAMQVDTYGFSPEQLDLSALRSIPESRVAAALGIPAGVLGFLSGMKQTTVGATMAELRELAYEQGIIPKMRLFTEELHTQLLPHYTDTPERFKVEFDTSDVRVLQEDENKLVERIDRRVQGGWMTVAAAKTAVGELPEPGDDVYLRKINVTEVGPDAPEIPSPVNVTPMAASRSYALDRKATSGQLAYLRQVDKSGQALTPRFAGELQRAFDDLGQRAVAAWEAAPQRFIADPVDEPTVAAILSALQVEDWRVTTLEPLWRRHYLRTAELTYEALRVNLGIDIGMDLPDPVARQVVAAGGRNLGLVDLTSQTRQALFEVLAEARAEGLGPVESARRLRRYVGAGRFVGMEREKAGSGVRYRSELIARTETLNAQRVSVAEAGAAAGFEHYLAFDNRTGFGDDECVAMDGAVLTYAEMLSAIADEHPNGTRSFAPIPASQVTARRGKVTEIQHVEYDEATGRMVKAWKEEVGG